MMNIVADCQEKKKKKRKKERNPILMGFISPTAIVWWDFVFVSLHPPFITSLALTYAYGLTPLAAMDET